MARSEAREGLVYRPLTAPGTDARELFGFVGAPPPPAAVAAGWGAWDGDRLVGALLLQRAATSAMLHGPVVVTPSAGGASDAIEVAARLAADALAFATTEGIDTVFTRPQGLDRVWVRAGFIPVPEVELPGSLRTTTGVGLFAWRGGTALWSAAGRGATLPAARRSER